MNSKILAILIFASAIFCAVHSQQEYTPSFLNFMCKYHPSNVEHNDCEFGFYKSACGKKKCFLSPGSQCEENDYAALIHGYKCHPSLACLCGRCSGHMTHNGIELSYSSSCQKINNVGKRFDNSNFDKYPIFHLLKDDEAENNNIYDMTL